MSIYIRSRFAKAVLYHTETVDTIAGAVSEANLAGANLRGAYLPGADLAGANLSGASLDEANLSGAILSGANLRGADLTGSNLSHADLRGADLRGADLIHVNLFRANLAGADLGGYLCQILGSRHPVLVYQDKIVIGCVTKTLDEWFDAYKRIGEENHYTTEQVKEYGNYIEMAKARMEAVK